MGLLFFIISVLFAGVLAVVNFIKKYMDHTHDRICMSVQKLIQSNFLPSNDFNVDNQNSICIDDVFNNMFSCVNVDKLNENCVAANNVCRKAAVNDNMDNKEPVKQTEIEEIIEEPPSSENQPKEQPVLTEHDSFISDVSKMKYEDIRSLLKNKYGIPNVKGNKLELIHKIKNLESQPQPQHQHQPQLGGNLQINTETKT